MINWPSKLQLLILQSTDNLEFMSLHSWIERPRFFRNQGFKKSLENSFRRDEPDDLADEIDQIQRAIEHCERRNQHEVS